MLWRGHKDCWLGWAPSPHVFLFIWAQAYVSDPKMQLETERTQLNNSDRSPLHHFVLTCWNGISGDSSGSVWPRWALFARCRKLRSPPWQSQNLPWLVKSKKSLRKSLWGGVSAGLANPRSNKRCFLNRVFRNGVFRGWSGSARARAPKLLENSGVFRLFFFSDGIPSVASPSQESEKHRLEPFGQPTPQKKSKTSLSQTLRVKNHLFFDSGDSFLTYFGGSCKDPRRNPRRLFRRLVLWLFEPRRILTPLPGGGDRNAKHSKWPCKTFFIEKKTLWHETVTK